MKRFLIYLALLMLVMPACRAQRFPVTVVGISDGDTFTVINRDKFQLKVRIYGIDAPEKGQAFGNRSKQALSSYIAGKDIEIDVQYQDRWGRSVAKAYTPEGEDVALLMLRDGMAWHFKRYDSAREYADAEAEARSAGAGLWADPNPTAPWDFRKSGNPKH